MKSIVQLSAVLLVFQGGLPTAAQDDLTVSRRAEPIVMYDLTPVWGRDVHDPVQRRRMWDETHLVVSLQGLVNRDAPRLYLRAIPGPDDFWWQRMTESGGWLADRRIEQIRDVQELLARFRSFYRGAVVWDERVAATSNLASTVAGCDDLLCLRYDESDGSLYGELTGGPGALSVQVRLIGDDGSPLFSGSGEIPGTSLPSTGSRKCDAYHWLIEHYVKSGKADPSRLGYYLDSYWLEAYRATAPQNHTLTNHDFLIARRGVLFDLNVWEDEACVDDPQQPYGTDVATLKALLHAAYERLQGNVMIHAAGFVPWAYKYTNFGSAAWSAGGRHDPVPTEWRYAEILSCYNAFMDADAIGLGAMANASFFQHYPLAERYAQNAKPTREGLIERGVLDAEGRIVPRRYVAHYVGDYDAAAWLYQQLPRMWQDPARGQTPLSWAFNPNLCERFPLGMAWAWENRTSNDFFVAGDSGAGYLNPGYLTVPRVHSGLPSGIAVWERHCQRFFTQWDISLTGFVIDGYAPGLSPDGLDAYARFSPDGIVPQKIAPQGVHNGMPYLRMGGDLPAIAQEAARVLRYGASGPVPRFAVFRSILQTPTWYLQVEQELHRIAGDEVRLVDLYTLMWLVREYEANPSRYEANQYQQAVEVSASPERACGLDPLYVADGPFTIEREGTESHWLLPAHPSARYFYLDVASSFFRPGQGSLDIEIEYRDAAPIRFGLEYDSTDTTAPVEGAYKPHRKVIQGGGGGEWRTAVFRVADARFRGQQNAMADFRFYYLGDRLLVRRVAVRRVE